MSIDKGYAAPVARVFDATGTEVFEGVVAFTYMHSEKVDDSSRIVIETSDIALVDNPSLQEGKQIKVVFGYLNKTRAQILYIWDVSAHFGDDYIRLEIIAYCKAAYMKLNSSKETYNNSNLKDVANAMGDKYGLNVIDGTDGKQIEEQTVFDYNGQTNNVLNVSSERDAGGKAYVSIARDNTAAPMKLFIPKKFDALPQAGASDAKQLDKMVSLDPLGDNLLVEGRDDNLIIKKRNLLQKPFRAYAYRSEPGYLLEFTPAIRNREYRKQSVGSNTGGWDEDLGRYFSGNIDGSTSSAPLLGESIERIQEQPHENSAQPFKESSDNGREIDLRKDSEKLDNGKEWANTDWYGVKKSPEIMDFNSLKLKTTVPVDEVALTFKKPISYPKEELPGVENNKKDAAGVAINRQVKKEQEINECTARIVGDPDIQSGKIITIMNVGKKYSGNYYIISAEHVIGPSGYIINLTIFRNGKKKLNDEDAVINAGYVGRTVNAMQAFTNDGTIQLSQIPIRKD